ncbi:hypothetical protein OF897_03295 [Chryseobacterium formosus]|uniref:DUF6705 domain-containing protein n=1 Tax=Chryseobacterium formosus TaxID=1537363 RepID=A0ABT3XN92_9FLAO|nr:DUF6705 family protein [Chryseobacterium formosus]MCX8522947.1 hypothetical protein [Chryseobacterium formosus]
MKNIITLFVALLAISCKSQIVSLEQAAQCRDNPNCPRDYNYTKDLNNTLNKYVGTWKGTYNGRVYEMKFNKNLYEDFIGFKRDIIKGRLRLTTTGNLPLTIFDNFNEPDDAKTRFTGFGLTGNLQSYELLFSGPYTKGCMNSGSIFLKINPSTPNQMRIIYSSDRDIAVGECPSSFTTTFPQQQEIFLTRQ